MTPLAMRLVLSITMTWAIVDAGSLGGSTGNLVVDTRRRIVSQMSRMKDTTLQHLEQAAVPAANCVHYWEQQTHAFAVSVEQHASMILVGAFVRPRLARRILRAELAAAT